MPLVRLTFARDRSPEETRAVCDAVYDAMRATFAVPENDRFIVVERPRPGDLSVDPHYPGDLSVDPLYMNMNRTDELVIVQITCNDTRTVDQKKALFATLAENLGRCDIPADDVFVNLIEVKKENWSFGRGIAQYA